MNTWNPAVILSLTFSLLIGNTHAQTSAPAPAAPAGADPAAKPQTPEALDKLLAPIALYPDALVIQIVQCAASPYQVKQVNDWLKKNPDLKGTAAQDAAAKEGFDASYIAIVLFPQVLQMMADKPEWTRDLGVAFTTQRDAVLESVQRLRKQAQSVGNLKTTEQQQVQNVKVESGEQVIVIQPANPQVVYVPQYDPQVVYVQTTTTTQSNNTNVGAAAIIGFAAGVIVGAAADNDNHSYYYHYGGWGYARPVCYAGGYNNYYNHRENMAKDYYNHRENMANDYYKHREDMAGQRGENQGQRQDARGENQGQRQDAKGENQASRQTQQDQNKATRSDNQANRQATAGETRTTNQSQRQSSGQMRAPSQTNRAASTSRGTFDGSAKPAATTGDRRTGAFSGIQSGATSRESSARGQSSMSGSRSRTSGGGGGGKRR